MRLVLVTAAALVALAVVPLSASAHPEACATGGVFSSQPTAAWFAEWTEESEGCLPASVVSRFDDSSAELAAGQSDGTDNLELKSNTPKRAPFETEGDFNSDLAFEDGYAYGGNYDGVQIWDVRDPDDPALAAFIHCPGSQNDVTVNDGILVTSTDSVRNKAECEGNMGVPTDSPSTASRPTGKACACSTSATRTSRST